MCRRAATRKSTTVSTHRLSRLHSARLPPLEIRCFIYSSFYYIYLFFPIFNVITIFLSPPSPLLPDENTQKNNRGIYTLAESKKTIIINYFEKKEKYEGAQFSPGRLARLPCGCDKTNRALWVLGLMEFRTSGSSLFSPSTLFLYLVEDVLGFNEVPPVLNEDSMRRRMGVGMCVAVSLLRGGGFFIAALLFLSPLPFSACETTQSRHLPPEREPLH